MVTVHSWDEVPAFASEDEEHIFWANHENGDELWDSAEAIPEGFLPPPRPRPVSVTPHHDEETVHRAKALAARRHTGYKQVLRDILRAQLAGESPAAPTRAER